LLSLVEFSAAGLMVPAPRSAPSPFVCVVYMIVDGATNHAGHVRPAEEEAMSKMMFTRLRSVEDAQRARLK
jgi:hypothetical protein